MHWGGDFGMGYGMGGFSWIFMIVFWGLVILGILYLINFLFGGTKKKEQKETPEDVLKKRFAKGEMNQEEFEKAMLILKQHD